MNLRNTVTPQAEPSHTGTPGWVASVVIGILTLCVVQLGAFAAGVWGGLDGTFTGPDSYMRLHRVLECVGGAGCPDGVLTRSNAPYGEAIHWPWLWDWAILTISAPFRLFLEFPEAVRVAGYLVGPLLGLSTIVLLTLAATRLGVGAGLPYVGLLAVTQPYIVFLFAYSRPDHHGVQTALFAAVLVASALAFTKTNAAWPRMVGVTVGLGLWLSTEALITAVPFLVALALAWALAPGSDWGQKNRDVALSAALTALLALTLDGPLAGFFSAEFDRLSIVHVTLFLIVAAYWQLVSAHPIKRLSRGAPRLAVGVLGGLMAFAIMTLLFPGFEGGPAADIPDILWTSWLNHTSEYVPLLRRTDATEVLVALASFLFAFPIIVWAALKSTGSQRYVWWTIGLAVVWFQGLGAFQQVRWSTYVHVLASLPVAWLLGRILIHLEGLKQPLARTALRVAIVSTAALAPTATALAGGLLQGRKDYTAVDQCEPGQAIEALATLRSLDGGPATILAPIFWGPEILFRTDLRIVATPYHRNVQGIVDSHRIMGQQGTALPQLIRDRGITHIAMCPNLFWLPYVERDQQGTLYSALATGNLPDWLRAAEVGAPPGVRILEVVSSP